MDDINFYICITVGSLKSNLTELAHLVKTQKAQIAVDCMKSLLQSITDQDFQEETNEQNMARR